MKKCLLICLSMICLCGCLNDDVIVVDRIIQDPVSIIEKDTEHPYGYIKTTPRVYILSIKKC